MGQVDLLWILGFLQDLERLIPLKKSSCAFSKLNG